MREWREKERERGCLIDMHACIGRVIAAVAVVLPVFIQVVFCFAPFCLFVVAGSVALVDFLNPLLFSNGGKGEGGWDGWWASGPASLRGIHINAMSLEQQATRGEAGGGGGGGGNNNNTPTIINVINESHQPRDTTLHRQTRRSPNGIGEST